MKLALAIGLGVFVVGFSTGNSQEVDRSHLSNAAVAPPAGFEKAVENSQGVDRTHLSGTPVPAPAGFEKAAEEGALAHADALRPLHYVEPPPMTSREVARAAAAMRTPRRCEAKDEPRDTSRGVLNAENAALERPIPRTNFFGRE
jgi:hypothetical protein